MTKEDYIIIIVLVSWGIIGIFGNLIIIGMSSEKELKEERKRMGLE